MKVFLMWSGEKSRLVAEKLRIFLEVLVQHPNYFVSTDNIQAGAVWENIIAGELETTNFGIACLEKESLNSLWIHFEAGAISKLSGNSKVIPYLIDVAQSDISGPLTKFKSIPANREGTFSLVESINTALDEDNRRSTKALEAGFGALWPQLEQVLKESTPSNCQEDSVHRTNEDILREILIRLRSLEMRAGDVASNSAQASEKTRQVEDEYVKAARKYAFKKAENNGWSRPGTCFDEEELAANTIVPRELTYFVLDSLRDRGLVSCVNWKGESTWMSLERSGSVEPFE